VLHILDHILALSHCLLTPPSPRILLQMVPVVPVVQVQQVRNFASYMSFFSHSMLLFLYHTATSLHRYASFSTLYQHRASASPLHSFAPLHRRQAESCVICAHVSPVICALTVLRHAKCRALLGSCVGVRAMAVPLLLFARHACGHSVIPWLTMTTISSCPSALLTQ
jgi:hypothetical protein